ncbi:hypothetical protein HQ545_00975 [Candidatus Woesearchaeota archaeon]|nr:hypothetical protein [Candidatus Woesearchaeota archaeon]
MKNKYILILGIIIIIISTYALVQTNEKKSDCESIAGQVLQFLDQDTNKDCESLNIWFFLSYLGLALGVALTVIGFIPNPKS